MLSLITPTRDRPEAFDLLQRWVGAQTFRKPYQWIVVNDGSQPYDYRMGQEVFRETGGEPGTASQKQNLLLALEHVRGNKVLILEDDDFYRPNYLERMDRMLDRYALAGEGRAAYYDVAEGRYHVWSNTEHASLAQTGFTAEALPDLAECCRGDCRLIDLELWSRFRGLKHVFTGAGLHVGIKGMPGAPGVYRAGEPEGIPDEDRRVFRAWSLPAEYERFHRRPPVLPAHDHGANGASGPSAGLGGAGRWDLIAPLGTGDTPRRYEGRCARKPWDYRVTAVIPHLNTPAPLRGSVETLRHQSEPPYILVLDTGSNEATCQELERMRGEDLEIHYLRSHAWTHASEPVAAAMDVAWALVHTEFLYCTHADCFVRRRDWIEWLRARCGETTPAIGYQMSDRSWLTRDWEWMVSHTATMLHVPTMRRIGASWSFERYRTMKGSYQPDSLDWMDTETGFNWTLRQAGITPVLLGPEANYERQTDDNIDHVRSFPSSTLYEVGSSQYREAKANWMAAALQEAEARVRDWSRGTPHPAATLTPSTKERPLGLPGAGAPFPTGVRAS